jgi:molybdate transport system ATP-binding protein
MIDVDIEQRLGAFELKVAFRAEAPIVGLFGRSGSGKTSVVNALAGTNRPQRGRIVINGEAVRQRSQHRPSTGQETPRLRIPGRATFPHWTSNPTAVRTAPSAVRRASSIQRMSYDCLGPTRRLSIAGQASGGENSVAIGRAARATAPLLMTSRSPRSTCAPDRLPPSSSCATICIFRSSSATPGEITRLADTVVLLADGKALASDRSR